MLDIGRGEEGGCFPSHRIEKERGGGAILPENWR